MNNSSVWNRLPPFFYLWIAGAIFASSSSVTRKIVQLGQNHLIEGRNPISLCNVLFVGNLCALLVMIPLFGKDWNPETRQGLSRKHWLSLTLVSLFSGALGPALVFTALGQTNVTNVVLIGRLEPILTLLLGTWLLGSKVIFWTWAGAAVSFLGIAMTVLGSSSATMVQMLGFDLGKGEIMAAVAAIFYSISTLITRKYLPSVPFGVVSIYRNIVGTIVFFILAMILYGSHHFADAFTPVLWQWMIVYALVIVVLGQGFWFRGFVRSGPAEVVLANSFNPILAIFFAYLVLGEVPTSAQYKAITLIVLGIISSWLGSRSKPRKVELESSLKGV